MSGNSENIPNFCSDCGKSLHPLNTVHLKIDCKDCGKTTYVLPPPSDEGQGIKVPIGASLTIPPGFLEMSLSPSSRGQFTRIGLAYFIQALIFAGQPQTPEDIEKLLELYENQSQNVLKNSSLLEGLDIANDNDAEEILKRISSSKSSSEWWASLMSVCAGEVQKAILQNNTRGAAWAMYQAVNAHAMLIFQEEFEDTLWCGYVNNKLIYDVASAASQTPAEVEALKKLEPLFSKLDEGTLYTWIESGLPISSRIGIKELPEETILALAKWHLSSFERRREEEKRILENKRDIRDTWIKGIATGAGVVGAIGTLLKAFGYL